MHRCPTLHLLAMLVLLVASGVRPAQSQANRTAAPSRLATRTTAANPVYLPLVRATRLDLSIKELEITQSVQTPRNSVPLVAGRPTIVRVYVQTDGGVPSEDITVALTGTRGGKALAPVVAGPLPVALAASRADYGSSFNALLPSDWLSGEVSMTIHVDSGNGVDEIDEANNSTAAQLKFNSVPPLDLVIVPVQYNDTPSGRTYPAPTEDTVSDWIMRAYPLSKVNVAIHAPVSFTGDLKSSSQWADTDANPNNDLLGLITYLKQTENPSGSEVYYGLVSAGTRANTWLPTSGGFILGIGWIGLRASTGLEVSAFPELPTTSEVAAHEIGHNLGRKHAPCAPSGPPAGIDPSYPAADASIVQFGLDVGAGELYSPSVAKDMMSYCEPRWVSDYTYTGLYQSQRATLLAAGAAAPPALLIRAGFDASGAASLAPIYALSGVPAALAASDYHVDFVDTSGQVVASQLVAVSEIEEPIIYTLGQGRASPHSTDTGAPPRAIVALVPRPAQPFAAVRLVHRDATIAARAFGSAGDQRTATGAKQPLFVVRGPSSVDLSWGLPEVPALVRYTADGGRTWTTLAADAPGGRLSVDPAALPGGGAGRFEVTPADGAGPAMSASAPAAPSDAAPTRSP